MHFIYVVSNTYNSIFFFRYQGREGWAPASYLKKSDIQSQRQSAGAAAHASANDLEGISKQSPQNNAKENRLSLFSDNNKSSK